MLLSRGDLNNVLAVELLEVDWRDFNVVRGFVAGCDSFASRAIAKLTLLGTSKRENYVEQSSMKR